jgi:hypothetical protein
LLSLGGAAPLALAQPGTLSHYSLAQGVMLPLLVLANWLPYRHRTGTLAAEPVGAVSAGHNSEEGANP